MRGHILTLLHRKNDLFSIIIGIQSIYVYDKGSQVTKKTLDYTTSIPVNNAHNTHLHTHVSIYQTIPTRFNHIHFQLCYYL